jgi:hypothetical protein
VSKLPTLSQGVYSNYEPLRVFVNEGWVPHCPDFLRRLVALIHSMRLSLMKGAHADLSSTAWFSWSEMPQHSTRLFCHPERL